MRNETTWKESLESLTLTGLIEGNRRKRVNYLTILSISIKKQVPMTNMDCKEENVINKRQDVVESHDRLCSEITRSMEDTSTIYLL